MNFGSGNTFINPTIPFPTFFRKQREEEERNRSSFSCWKTPVKFLINALKHIKVKVNHLNKLFSSLETIFQIIPMIQENVHFQKTNFHHINLFVLDHLEAAILLRYSCSWYCNRSIDFNFDQKLLQSRYSGFFFEERRISRSYPSFFRIFLTVRLLRLPLEIYKVLKTAILRIDIHQNHAQDLYRHQENLIILRNQKLIKP